MEVKRPPLIADHKTAVLVGAALTAAGAYMLWEAYEGRGRRRPWFLKWAAAGLT